MKALWIAAIVALLVVPATSSADTEYHFTGHACQPDHFNYTAFDYSSNGLTDNSSNATTQFAWCPVTGNESSTVDLEGATFFVYDGHDENEVSCTIYVRNSSGTTYSSSTKGSGDATTGYTTMSWSTTDLPNSGSSISNVVTYALYCNVPTKFVLDATPETQSQTFLRGYDVTQVNP